MIDLGYFNPLIICVNFDTVKLINELINNIYNIYIYIINNIMN